MKSDSSLEMVQLDSSNQDSREGGNYSCICGISAKDHQNIESCLRKEIQTLEERRQVVVSGVLWKKLMKGVVNPFSNLNKAELTKELSARGIETVDTKKSELQEELNNILHGIQRPPALMTKNPKSTAAELGIPSAGL